MTTEPELILATLAAKQDITEALFRYCRAMDRKDRSLGRAVWHPDGVADYGQIFQGTGAEFVEWVTDLHETLAGTSHQVANILIDVDGAAATSEAYVTVAIRSETENAQRDVVRRGRYLDRWAYRDGRWGIEHRHYVPDL